MVKDKKIVKTITLDIATAIKHPSAFPWDIKDKSVAEITCNGVLELIPSKMRGKFMDELYRILSDDGRIAVTVPYYNSWTAIHDYRFEWPPFCEQSFLMFNKEWREANKKYLELDCNFDFTYGYNAEPEVAARNDETRSFQIKHYNNTVNSLSLILIKRK